MPGRAQNSIVNLISPNAILRQGAAEQDTKEAHRGVIFHWARIVALFDDGCGQRVDIDPSWRTEYDDGPNNRWEEP
jgi:hypothetical protein